MYAKLFAQVVASSLTHNETIDVRGVFFMLLAIADKEGHVPGVDPSIARIINVPAKQFAAALERLMAPDEASQSQAFEGRRVMRLDGDTGLFIVNYAKYQGILNDEQRRAYFRQKKAEQRARVAQQQEAGQEVKARARAGNRPDTVEEVIGYGAMQNVPERTCRKFWLNYEATSSQDENGQVIWVTGEKGEKVVGDWRALLLGWKTKDEERAAGNPGRRGMRSEAEREPEEPRKLEAETIDPTTGKLRKEIYVPRRRELTPIERQLMQGNNGPVEPSEGEHS
jgi:hypothetical protein